MSPKFIFCYCILTFYDLPKKRTLRERDDHFKNFKNKKRKKKKEK